ADETVEVGTGAERLVARPGEHRDADSLVVVDVLPGVGKAAQHLGVDRVAHLGPVHGDDGDAVALLVQDCRFGHRSGLRDQRSEPTTHMAKYCAPPPYA